MNKKVIMALKMFGISIALIMIYKCAVKPDNLEQKEKYDIDVEKNGANTSYSFSMGTAVTVSIYGIKQEQSAALMSEDVGQEIVKVEQAIDDLDKRVISWREETSEIGKLDTTYTVGKPVAVSDELYVALKLSYEVCEKTDGALDISIRPLAKCWNIEAATPENFNVPDQSAIERELEKVDYSQIILEDHQVALQKPDMILDLGAVGKGYALDIVREMLKKDGVSGATVSVGGSILVYGEKADGEAFRVGVRDPQGDMEDMIGYLEFEPGSSMCISTSGDYEKYIEKDGKKYHHILDSKTGYPVENKLASVTVVCENGLYSDALSTACYVLGEEKAREILPSFDAEAIFIDKENHISVTEGLQNRWIVR